MKITGTGYGTTPEEARANALQDLEDKKLDHAVVGGAAGLLVEFGVGLIALAFTFYAQVLLRPLPALVALGLGCVLVGAGYIALIGLFYLFGVSDVVTAFILMIILLAISAKAMPYTAPILQYLCATFEMHERRIIVQLPGVVRVPVALATALVPSICLLVLLASYDWSWVLPGGGGFAASELWWGSFVGWAVLALFQLYSTGHRTVLGRELQDYTWTGALIPPRHEWGDESTDQ